MSDLVINRSIEQALCEQALAQSLDKVLEPR
jgi:hypothetical protein